MTSGADFTDLLKQASAAENLEEKIRLAEAALALEPSLSDWPLRHPRDRVKAAIYAELGFFYQQRVEGVAADNMERAIAATEAGLKLLDRDEAAEVMADALHNLAIAYTRRILGEPADNIERAISYAEAALSIFKRDSTPGDWARAKIALGVAYDRRIRGDSRDNTEKAIAAYQASLSALTRESSPLDWAGAQKNLAITYAKYFEGNIADNFNKAITAYNAALSVFTEAEFPEEWHKIKSNIATIQSNIATLYSAKDFESGIVIASNPELHQRFLSEFIVMAPDYTAERMARHWEPYRDMLDETEVARRKGLPETNPGQWQAWQLRLQAAREFIESNIEHDRVKNSAAHAKRVLEKSLKTGTPFVLILRSFSLEVRELSGDELQEFPAGFRVQSVRGSWSARAVDALAAIIHPHYDMLTIVNNDDYWPPEDIPKFYLPNQGWRKVVFSLIAQADAIVMLLPMSLNGVTGGVMQEIEAIRILRASERTIAIAERGEEISNMPDGEFGAVRTMLQQRGITRTFKADEVIAAPQDLLTELKAALSLSG